MKYSILLGNEEDFGDFDQNQIIRSEYVSGSGGHRRMFFRKSGTAVEQRQGDCGYTAGEDSVIIQWDGAPTFDSGYHASYFPPTTDGLKAAHAEMDGLGN